MTGSHDSHNPQDSQDSQYSHSRRKATSRRSISGFLHLPWNSMLKRVVVVCVLIAIYATFCVVRLAGFQLGGASVAQQATASRTVTVVTHGTRGEIVDTNGQVLAQSVERYTMYADQNGAAAFKPVKCTGTNSSICQNMDGTSNPDATGVEAVAELLAPLLGVSEMELGGELAGTSSYVVLQKNVTPQLKQQVEALHLSTVIGFESTSQRQYPDGTLLGDVLGGVNDEGTGVAGIELMMNDALQGQDGSTTYQQALTGERIPGTQTDASQALNGGTVKLTIDSDVQWYVEQALKEGVTSQKAKWGVAVVQEVSTGKILAIADSQDITAGSDEAKTTASLAMTQTFEPGSTGKVITTAALYQEGLQNPTNQFTIPNTITVDGQTYKDAEAHSVWHLTSAGILCYSSNVGTIMESSGYSLEKRYEYLRKFGIGQDSGINFPGATSGLLSDYSQWDGRTQNVVLFGQGYAVTALQMTNVVATIANGGVRLGQSLIESATDANGTDVTPSVNETTRVIDESAAANTLNAMESVAEKDNKWDSIPGYRFASKSGTAQVAGDDGTLSSIVADYIIALPANDPKFVVSVFMKDPAGTEGAWTSGPVTAKIGQFLMQKYKVPQSPARTDAIPVKW